ncbi:hypothetical protein BH10PSE7_BH10PSE7_39190 [soil metagenome]
MIDAMPRIPPHVLRHDMTLDTLLAAEHRERQRLLMAVAARVLSAVIGAGLGVILALAILMWLDNLSRLA